MIKTPILFLIFNRMECSLRVLEAIRAEKPKCLFIAADGPRSSVDNEDNICQQVRLAVDSAIDWDCEVKRLYRDKNLGCRIAASSAIDWFFDEVHEGIILEDDTLPTKSFFSFAETMLDRYRDNVEIMHVSGNNHQHGRIRGDGSYYASRFAHSWGWATWRRAWRLYDIEMCGFPVDWDAIAQGCSLPKVLSEWWRTALENVTTGITNTWDFQWHYAVMKNRGICLIPNRNLVENIGVGSAATHMKKRNVASSIRSSWLRHFYPPTSLGVCHEADRFDFAHAVKNQKVPFRNWSELTRSWSFDRRQRQ